MIIANPQLEDGYTAIANEIMESLCRIRIPGEERQILDCIFRKTYGWHKTEDAISLSQFSVMTGINKPCVIRAIQGLLSKKIINVIEKDNAPAKVYKFNKDFHQWQPLSKKITLSKKIIGVIKKDNPSLSKKIPTKTTTTKTTITKTRATLPAGLSEETFSEYLDMRKKIKKPLLEKSFNRFFKSLSTICQQNKASPEDILNQSILNSWQGIFPLKQEFKNVGTSKNFTDSKRSAVCAEQERKADEINERWRRAKEIEAAGKPPGNT